MSDIDYGVRTYVRRSGRITESQKRNYEELFPKYCLEYLDYKERGVRLDFTTIFGNENPVVMEIGFGMGDATALIAKANPGTNYLALDVFRAGVGKLLGKIEEHSLENIRIIEHDCIEVLDHLVPERSLAGFHIFFPDPWPKKRHHKRRLMQKNKIELMSTRLVDKGYIYMVTDWEPYAMSALEELRSVNSLENTSKTEDGFTIRKEWRPETNFEKKALKKGHIIRELFFKKR